jgi:twinkle protein
MSDALEIKADLQARILDVCQYLLPGGRRRGREYLTASLAGGKGESLRVHLAGSKAGTWAEFNGDEQRGDVFDLIRAVRRCSFVEALDWARDYTGREPVRFERVAPARVYRRPARPADCRRPAEGSAVAAYLASERRLTAETLRAYQIAEGTYPAWTEHAGGAAIVFPYKRAGELVMVKWLLLDRPDGKKAVTTTKDAEPCLFGWQAIPDDAREVVIAEGEIDAATWWQMGWPALAPPRGTGSLDWIDVEYPALERFETVYLAFDNDEAGRKAVEKIAPRFGDRARIVGHLDFARYGKDANAWLQAGATADDFAGLLSSAGDNRPVELRSPVEYAAEVVEEFYPPAERPAGFEPPFGKIAGRVRFRPGELSIWTGYNHHGKSEFLNFLMTAAVYQGERVCLASLEVRPENTIARLVRQSTAERRPSPERIRSALEWLSRAVLVCEHAEAARLERLLEVFGYAARRYGVSQFVLDNLAMLGIGEDDYDRQKATVSALASFALRTRSHVHLVAHPRKASDESEIPGKLDVRGGAAITDLAHNVFAVWKDAEKAARLSELEVDGDPRGEIRALVESKPDTVWACRKQRETGDTPMCGLWFHRDTLQFHERPFATPFAFMDPPRAAAHFARSEEPDDAEGFVQWEDDGKRPF